MKFEILEHTADIGLRAWGATFAELLANASEGLVSIAVEPEDIAAREAYALEASAETREDLLVNWLNEVLYHLDGKRIAFRRFEVSVAGEFEARGQGWGEERSDRHRAKLIVKGVTYHQLRVVQEPNSWVCEVYLDI